jgi:hypothetical protein
VFVQKFFVEKFLEQRLFFLGKQFVPQGIPDPTPAVGASPLGGASLALTPGAFPTFALPAYRLPPIRIHFKKWQTELTPPLAHTTFFCPPLRHSPVGAAPFLTSTLLLASCHIHESR